jgi:hypothetical protein
LKDLHPMKKTLPALCAASLLLSACAYHWERAPGHEQAVFEEDDARCYLMSRGMPQTSYAFAGGGTGRAGAYAAGAAGIATAAALIGLAIQQQRDKDSCMTLAGWRHVTNSEQAAK